MKNLQMAEPRVIGDGDTLDVVDIWPSIQGEGPFAGCPAVFIRLAGCLLQCPQCFGVGVKGRIPRLTMSYGPRTRLDKIKEGATILTFDENMSLVETEVVKIIEKTTKEWLEIRIGNKTYDVTPEHPFFTSGGLVSASDLAVGDDILEARETEVTAFKKMGDRNPMKDPEVALRSFLNTDYKATGRKTSATLQRKIEEGTYIPVFHRLSPEAQEAMRANQRLAKLREKNPNWTGRNKNLLDVQESIALGHSVSCENCRKSGCKLLIHHKDGNHDNDDRNNLAVWCHLCHNRHHQRGYNFWNGKRKDGKEIVKKHNGRRVLKIKECRGSLPTINLSCSPFNTYLADRLWVHNCDTDYTTDREQVAVDGIISQVRQFRKSGLVVITGGEPYRQPIQRLVVGLFDSFSCVQVETNGMVFQSLPKDTTIVCSPKTATIHAEFPHVAKAFKYVLSVDAIDPDDGLPTSVLGMPGRPYRPPEWYTGEIYVQPADEGDAEKNKRNVEACVASAMKFSYRVSVQLHKILGVP